MHSFAQSQRITTVHEPTCIAGFIHAALEAFATNRFNILSQVKIFSRLTDE